ncbi:hypothetical protein MTO96_039840 [Rhipicephalus appendiculatus]
MEDGIVLPDQLRSVLELGPKYAIAPRKTRPELLSIVRQVSRLVPQEDSDHCIAEGVGVLFKTRPNASRPPVHRAVTFLKEQSLCVLPADKEGGFQFCLLPLSNLRQLLPFQTCFRLRITRRLPS